MVNPALATVIKKVDSVLLQAEQLTVEDIARRLGEPTLLVRQAVRSLVKRNKAHCITPPDKRQVFRWGPATQQTVASVRAFAPNVPYVPPKWTNEISRPGGEDHKRYGSLQADGTVKPFHTPIHACTTNVTGPRSQARD